MHEVGFKHGEMGGLKCELCIEVHVGFSSLMNDSFAVFLIFCRILDIEHEMTNFAYYYVGIAAAVFLLGYFQVRLRMLLCSHKETDPN